MKLRRSTCQWSIVSNRDTDLRLLQPAAQHIGPRLLLFQSFARFGDLQIKDFLFIYLHVTLQSGQLSSQADDFSVLLCRCE